MLATSLRISPGVLLIASLVLPRPATAEVLDKSSSGFTVRTTVQIAASPAVVYAALTESVGRWWDDAHTWSGSAANLSIDARPGGCFCEKLPGGGVLHMIVIFADRGKTLRMSGGLGPLQAMAAAGVLTYALTDAAGQTTLEATYAVLAYSRDDISALASAVDQVTGSQVARLKRHVEGR